MVSEHRTFLKVFLGGLLIVLPAIAAFNLVVDPYEVYRLWPESPLNDYKGERKTWTFKAEMVHHEKCTAAILGSSRVLWIDPHSRHWGPGGAYNLGLRAATMEEVLQVFHYTVGEAPLQRVFLCVDFFQFNVGESPNDMQPSRFNRELTPVEYHLDKLIGMRATRASFKTLGYWLRDKPTPYTSRGRIGLVALTGAAPTRRRMEVTVRGYAAKFRRYQEDPRQMECFRNIVRTCRRRNLELTVLIPPVHACHLETIRLSGKWDQWERWKRQLVNVLDGETNGNNMLWDFTGYSPYTTEPLPEGDEVDALEWFAETSHFKENLADLLLEVVYGKASNASFGRRLCSANLDAHLAEIRRDRRAWLEQSPQTAAWVATTGDFSPAAVRVATPAQPLRR